MSFDLALIEQQAAARGLLLRLQLGGAGPLQTLRVVVARRSSDQSLALLGELKGWATPQRQGLRLDTMRVRIACTLSNISASFEYSSSPTP